jgi:hypothetical protein
MRSSIMIDQAAAGSRRSLSWPQHYGGLSMLIVMVILFGTPNVAFAQYPGFGGDAEPAAVSAAADDAPSGSSGNAAAASNNDVAASSGANTEADSATSSGLSGVDNDDSKSSSNVVVMGANRVKARQSRAQYFVRKLRVEFAAMELVEHRTGVAFSRHDVPRYLGELRAELAKMDGLATAPVQSLAQDVQHIDTELNKHIDQLLGMIGTPANATPDIGFGFFTPEPPLPKTLDAATAKIASISLKYELMDYGEKALQAMGAGYR